MDQKIKLILWQKISLIQIYKNKLDYLFKKMIFITVNGALKVVAYSFFFFDLWKVKQY